VRFSVADIFTPQKIVFSFHFSVFSTQFSVADRDGSTEN
jgi:hypothetical protein